MRVRCRCYPKCEVEGVLSEVSFNWLPRDGRMYGAILFDSGSRYRTPWHIVPIEYIEEIQEGEHASKNNR